MSSKPHDQWPEGNSVSDRRSKSSVRVADACDVSSTGAPTVQRRKDCASGPQGQGRKVDVGHGPHDR